MWFACLSFPQTEIQIGQFCLRDMHAGNSGSCTHRLGLKVCFDYVYQESLQACLTERIGYCRTGQKTLDVLGKRSC